MELIVEAVLTRGFSSEDAMGEFLDRVDLTGAQAELFFAEWNDETKTITCVFQVEARSERHATRQTSGVVKDALKLIDRSDLAQKFEYTTRLPEKYDEPKGTSWKDALVAGVAATLRAYTRAWPDAVPVNRPLSKAYGG